MSGLVDDVARALRALRARPALALVAVLTLGLGIGASTTLYSAFLPFVYEMPPVRDADRLALVLRINPSIGVERGRATLAEFSEWREQARSVEALDALTDDHATLTAPSGTRRVSIQRVTSAFFDTVGVAPQLGRTFRADDGGAAPRVVVISDALWRSALSADPAALGRTIDLNDTRYTVVGVMPPGFWFGSQGFDAWVPLAVGRGLAAAQTPVSIVMRRRPDATWSVVQAEIETLGARTAGATVDASIGWRTLVVPLRVEATKRLRGTPAVAMFGPPLLLLLIGCVNVANLLLADAVARGRELSVRAALGASRARLIRQLMIESAWLALGGGGVGVLLSFWGVEIFRSVANASMAERIVVAPSAVAAAALLTLATPLAFGLIPAIRTSAPNVVEMLRDGTRGERLVRGYRLRDLLVPLELALTVVLVVTTALLLRFFWELGRLPPGFDTRNLYALRTRLARAEVTPDDVSARAASLIDALAGVEGVEAVAIASRLPLGGEASLVVTPQAVRPEGPNRRQASGRPVAARTAVSPGFFATLGIPVVRGRGFSELDGTGSPRVAVVSAHLARAWWPGEDPLGKTVRLGGPSSPDAVTVVGVAGDVMSSHTLRSPYLYLPLAQDPQPTMYVLARLPRAVVDQAAVKRAIASVPPFALDEIMSVEDALAHRLDGGGFVMGLIGVFTVLSLLLATVGVYTVISHTTAQRTREIGVRVALGAGRLDVLRAVVGPMVALCAVGLGVGALGTVLVTRVTWSLLIDVSGTSPTVWAAVLGVLGVAAILACAAPVRLALSVDPAVVLRHN